jgi:activated CDC42 kinase 1
MDCISCTTFEILNHDCILFFLSSNRFWYKGQNTRTLKIGYFSRVVLNPERKLTGEDISLPLENSFIHTGHISRNIDNFWGSLDRIDEYFFYLK